MADYIRPTPRNPILGLLADALTGGVQYMRDPRRAQQMQGLGGLLAETGIPATMERLSYGEPLTKGKGMTTRLRPEAEAALLTLGPEAVPIGRGAMAAVKATKGLPVGMGIKPINLADAIFKPELTMKEMQLVKDIPTVQRVQASIDLVGEKKFQEMVESQFKKYKPTDQDQEAMLVESVTLNILGRANRQPELLQGLPGLRTPAPREEALRLAQQRAALPVSEGGLGLPPNNTPMDRARAMGFADDTFHGTFNRFDNFDLSKANPRSQYMQGVFTADKPAKAENYGDYIMPLMQRKGVTVEDKRLARQAGLSVPTVDTIHDKAAGVRVTNNPANIRSRFAAFDPTRRNEPDLLAGALPFTALLDEENRAMLEQRLGGLLDR